MKKKNNNKIKYGMTQKQMVYEILSKYPETRDNDNELSNRYWEYERRNREYIAIDYGLIKGELNSQCSITSAKRKIQKDAPWLRGDTYNERQIMGGQKKKDKVDNIDQYQFSFANNLKNKQCENI